MDHTFSTEAIDGTEVSRISIEGELDARPSASLPARG